ncbi:MAG: MMPL family transporter, partial [Gammaproteobacteria bacterium]|nr:MMPL family transporter [Gammaproteobacteria bacterium]
MDWKLILDSNIRFVLGHPKLTIFLSFVVLMMCVARAGYLTNSQNFRDLLNDDNPELVAFDELDNVYAQASSNSILMAVVPESGNIFTRKALGVIEDLTERAWLLPYAVRVDSLTNYAHSSADGDDLIIENLVEDSASLTDQELQRIADIALGQPELKNRLLSGDGRIGGMLINFALPEERSEPVREVNDSLDALIAAMQEAYGDTAFYAVGEMVSNRALTDTTESELAFLVPSTLIIILLTALLLTRSVVCTLATFFLMLINVGAVMGIMGWFSIVLTPISAYTPIVMMAFSVAYSIHIINGILAGMRRGWVK